VQDARMPRQDNTTIVVIVVGEKLETQPKPDHGPARLVNVASTPPPAPRPAPIPIDMSPEPSGLGKTMGVAGVLVVLALGAGYWYWQRSLHTPALEIALPEPAPGEVEQSEVRPSLDAADQSPETPTADTLENDEGTRSEVESSPVTAPVTGTGKTFRDGPGPLMVQIPNGTYLMGSPDSAADFTERPQHSVKIAAFAIGVYEVTIAEYGKFTAATGRRAPKTGELERTQHPVFFISWDDALAYTQWLSKQTGRDYRLPSEAQWEFAARGGTSSNYWWGRNIDEGKAHCIACETGLDARSPTKIGRFTANPYGVFDSAGNVQEWVYDCYHQNYEGAPTDGSVFEGGDCKLRIIRGGAFSSGPKGLRSAARDKLQANAANDSVGFRVVRVD
ncbi:MAG: formylglycine-generating enzyme family protein, partial [Gammaproteobacteria bacterium]